MTEDEAKTKWCPFARVSTPILDATRTWGGTHPKIGAETANRGVREQDWPMCIGCLHGLAVEYRGDWGV